LNGLFGVLCEADHELLDLAVLDRFLLDVVELLAEQRRYLLFRQADRLPVRSHADGCGGLLTTFYVFQHVVDLNLL